MRYKLGIDVGGTFTDFVVVLPDGTWELHKVPSTPADPSVAVLNGLADMAAQRGVTLTEFLGRVERIVHGTTVATNALLTGNGARTGLVTTAGLRDALEMRRGIREERYNNKAEPPPPLVPRHLRLPVRGRLGPEGQEIEPLHPEDAEIAAANLRAAGVEAVAVCLMHSYLNPEHERQVLAILRRELPEAYITGSAELLPQVGFYERVSTTVLNAVVGPILARYLERLVDRLQGAGFSGVLLIMQSNGGVTSWDTAVRTAVTTLLSGPAGGPVAGAQVSGALGFDECVAVDMGGTSFEAALVRGGRPLLVTEAQVARYASAFPVVDVHTIGAGGGSIGWIDDGGLLRMGPKSAGAVPGPACYGQGGDQPTCTDANLVLGFLDPRYFLGGRIDLDATAARSAIEQRVARPLGISIEEAAAGMFRVINANMAAGIRAVSVRRGIDPRTMPLVVAGGAGPIHAGAIAADLQIPVFVVPRFSSIFCAAGMLYSDLRHDFVQTFRSGLASCDCSDLAAAMGHLEEQGATLLRSEGIDAVDMEFVWALDMRYLGQHHDVTVTVAPANVRAGDRAEIAERFHRQHDQLYGYCVPAAEVEIINVRVTVVGRTRKPALQAASLAPVDSTHACKGERQALFPVAGTFGTVRVYDGTRLVAGNEVPGPAIVELSTTTVVVPDGSTAVVEPRGSFVVVTDEALAGVRKRLSLVVA